MKVTDSSLKHIAHCNPRLKMSCLLHFHCHMFSLATADVGKNPQVFFSPKAVFLNPNLQSPPEDSSLVFTVSPVNKNKKLLYRHLNDRMDIFFGCAKKISTIH